MSRVEDIRVWFSELSLATKCLLLFGGASALIIAIALTFPLLRMNGLVSEKELGVARTIYEAWNQPGDEPPIANATVAVLTPAEARDSDLRFVRRSIERFEAGPNAIEQFQPDWTGWGRIYRYARVRRNPDASVRDLVLIERNASGAALLVNFLYLAAAGSAS